MKDLIAIDVTIPTQEIHTSGIAYYRISPDFRTFLLRCKKEKGVIGFEYDFDSLNFGVILAPEEEIKKTEEEERREEILKEKESEIKKKK